MTRMDYLSNGTYTKASKEASAQNTSVNGGDAKLRVTIPLNNEPGYTPTRKLRVITIGAGYSGLTLAHKFQHQHPEMQDLIEHVIFESRDDVGGTWLVNTYPGVICDVPSHIYVRQSYFFRRSFNSDYARLFLSTRTRTGPISTLQVRRFGNI